MHTDTSAHDHLVALAQASNAANERYCAARDLQQAIHDRANVLKAIGCEDAALAMQRFADPFIYAAECEWRAARDAYNSATGRILYARSVLEAARTKTPA